MPGVPMLLLLGGLGTCVPPLSGQSMSTDLAISGDPAEQQTYPVHGTVVNSLTHQPIAHALVNGQWDAALTDSEGRFELHLPLATIFLMVEKPGYGAGKQTPGHMIQVASDLPGLTFPLTPDSVITGQVTLPGADSAAGVRIMAYRRSVVNGLTQWVMDKTAEVDSEGEFRIGGMQPGAYLLYTQPEREQDTRPDGKPIEYGYPAVYYPGETDPSAAGVLTVTAGQHAEADFALNRKPFYAVTVKVTNQPGGRGGGVRLFDAEGRPVELPMQRGNQQVTVNLPNGGYYFEARSWFGPRSGFQASDYGRVDFKVVGRPIPNLSLTLFPLRPVPVTVHKDFTAASATDGGSINGSINFAQGGGQGGGQDGAASPGLNVWLSPVDTLFGQMVASNLRPIAGSTDGTSFELDGVTPGRYWVMTYPFQGYVSSVTSGGVDLAREPLVIGPGDTSPAVEVTLRNDGGTVNAQYPAPTSAPPGAAPAEQRTSFVYAVPLFPTTGQLQQLTVPATGNFSIGNLAPGSYRILAFDRPQEIDFRSPQGLAKYGHAGQVVTVEAGGTASVQLEVLPGAEGTEGDVP